MLFLLEMHRKRLRIQLLFQGILLLLLAVYNNPFAEGQPLPGNVIAQEEFHHYEYKFEENKGQWDNKVLFRCRIPSGYMFIERTGLTYLLYNNEEKSQLAHEAHETYPLPLNKQITVHGHVVRARFIEANDEPVVSTERPFAYYYNYFIGRDRSKWASRVRSYREVLIKGIYDGIDIHFYTDKFTGDLKYDWIVSPGADYSKIIVEIEGAESMSKVGKSLAIRTSVGMIYEQVPVVYRSVSDAVASGLKKFEIEGNLELSGNSFTYSIEEGSGEGTLTIDPVLIFSTYSGSEGDNFGFTATYDSKGNLYAGGIMDITEGKYPVTTGAFQTIYGGGDGKPPANLPSDITLSKYDSSGSTLLWASYLGGSEDEYPHSLVVDYNDDLVVMGTTYSSDFPTTPNAYDTVHGGVTDILVTRISSDGTTMMASTLVGGSLRDGQNTTSTLRYNYADDFRGDIIPDLENNMYITSTTLSIDFPMVNAIDETANSAEGIVFELKNDLSELLWSTYLGGSGNDALYSIKIDTDSNVYVGGGSISNDLKTTPDAYQMNKAGGVDGFIASFSVKNRKLKNMTYFGTSSYDQVYFIEIDNKGSVYCMGQTEGNIAPSPNVYGEPNKGQFVAKLDTSLKTIAFQTSFGNRDNRNDLAPSAFLVDNCEHIYVSGWGSAVSADHPGSTNGLEISGDAIQSATDGNDFYILVLAKNAESLLFATYFGGDTAADHVDGGTSRFDKKGVVYQSVCASCPDGDPGQGHQDFPVTPNAAFTKNVSYRCSNASFKIDLQIRGAVVAEFVPSPVYGCAPLSVDFNNRGSKGATFLWDFGDGTFDSINLNPTHVYADVGTYTITLKVFDSTTCNVNDLYKRTIQVVDQANADFEFKVDGCNNEVEFTNKSDGRDFIWKFGDGSTSTNENVKHTYSAPGDYLVELVVDSKTDCPDSIFKTIRVQPAYEKELLVPNIFTPDHDGYNDCYFIEGVDRGCYEFLLEIYNRWGERLYRSSDPTACWDGVNKISDINYPEGTYFYILSLERKDNGKTDLYEGTITLLRD